MCGRFVGFRSLSELKAYFPIDEALCEVSANYNVAPSQQILAIVRHDGKHLLKPFHWGLVPFWAKDTAIGQRLINARSETAAEKPSFRNAFKKRRCLILADGFYEWKRVSGKKHPLFITLPDERPFAFAGLWETWRDPHAPGTVYLSCAILTRASTGIMKTIHHRMPVILHPEAYPAWLEPTLHELAPLKDLLAEKSITDLAYRPVSRQVNPVGNNSPANIIPIQTEFDFKEPL
jgi:putative SOS response-associated peptidase YedK